MKGFIIFCCCFVAVSSETFHKWHKTEDGTQYYIEIAQQFNWQEAIHQCARFNMTLLALNTPHKHEQISALFDKIFPTCPKLWLAGQDNVVNKLQQWVITGQAFDFTNWASGEPRRIDDKEMCVAIWKNKWEWSLEHCTKRLGYICEENRLLRPTSDDSQQRNVGECELKLQQMLKEKQQEIEELKKTCQSDKTSGASYKNYNVVVHVNPKLQ